VEGGGRGESGNRCGGRVKEPGAWKGVGGGGSRRWEQLRLGGVGGGSEGYGGERGTRGGGMWKELEEGTWCVRESGRGGTIV